MRASPQMAPDWNNANPFARRGSESIQSLLQCALMESSCLGKIQDPGHRGHSSCGSRVSQHVILPMLTLKHADAGIKVEWPRNVSQGWVGCIEL